MPEVLVLPRTRRFPVTRITAQAPQQHFHLPCASTTCWLKQPGLTRLGATLETQTGAGDKLLLNNQTLRSLTADRSSIVTEFCKGALVWNHAMALMPFAFHYSYGRACKWSSKFGICYKPKATWNCRKSSHWPFP